METTNNDFRLERSAFREGYYQITDGVRGISIIFREHALDEDYKYFGGEYEDKYGPQETARRVRIMKDYLLSNYPEICAESENSNNNTTNNKRTIFTMNKEIMQIAQENSAKTNFVKGFAGKKAIYNLYYGDYDFNDVEVLADIYPFLTPVVLEKKNGADEVIMHGNALHPFDISDFYNDTAGYQFLTAGDAEEYKKDMLDFLEEIRYNSDMTEKQAKEYEAEIEKAYNTIKDIKEGYVCVIKDTDVIEVSKEKITSHADDEKASHWFIGLVDFREDENNEE